jgi:hypothetical protein
MMIQSLHSAASMGLPRQPHPLRPLLLRLLSLPRQPHPLRPLLLRLLCLLLRLPRPSRPHPMMTKKYFQTCIPK